MLKIEQTIWMQSPPLTHEAHIPGAKTISKQIREFREIKSCVCMPLAGETAAKAGDCLLEELGSKKAAPRSDLEGFPSPHFSLWIHN